MGRGGIPSDSDALPAPLRSALEHEPRVTDPTWRARDADDLSLSYPKFREAVADLAAPLHGRDKDELASEEVFQHRRTVPNPPAAPRVPCSTLGPIACRNRDCALAPISRSEAVHQQHLATSRALAAESLLALPKRHPQPSLLAAVQSAKASDTPEALSALRAALPQNLQLRKLSGFPTAANRRRMESWRIARVDRGTRPTGQRCGTPPRAWFRSSFWPTRRGPPTAAFDRTGGEVLAWESRCHTAARIPR